MKLQTFIEIPASSWQIGYDDRILLLGSCFSDEIGSKLQEHYFRLTSNPFGTLYNPLSIAQALQMREVPELVEYGGLWHSMAHHGSFSFASRTETYEAVSRSIRTLQQAFQDASVVMITFGTAWIYEQDGRVVGNCHKMPADCFTRRRLSVEEIVAAWQPILAAYPDKKWLFTVSPIRHVKDGLHENQLSKATLLMAVEQLSHHQSPINHHPSPTAAKPHTSPLTRFCWTSCGTIVSMPMTWFIPRLWRFNISGNGLSGRICLHLRARRCTRFISSGSTAITPSCMPIQKKRTPFYSVRNPNSTSCCSTIRG